MAPILDTIRSKMSGGAVNGHARKLLVVFGATGKQGGSVVRSILKDPKTASMFSVRAITRDPSKDSAKELAYLGAECHAANIDDKASLKGAMEGADAVFAVTNFWEKMSADVEIQQGKNIADVAKEVGVKHLIWSSLLNVTKLSKGKLDKVVHFDSKATVEEYIRQLGIPATFFLPGFFMSNIPGQSLNNMQGAYNFALPIPTDSPIPLFDVSEDTGKFVKAILLNREKVLGARIYGATDYYTPKQIISTFQEVKPEDGSGGNAIQVPEDKFKAILASKGLPETAQNELLQNMLLMSQFGYYGGADLKESKAILEEPPTSWKEFVAKAPAWAAVH